VERLNSKYIELVSDAQVDSNKISILFVDDEQNILSSLKRLFRPLEYSIYLASGGEEGLRVLNEEKIDLVISDMRMPNMDGVQFLEQVAKFWPGTIRILLTGYADMKSTISAINKGDIFKYVSKPWEDNDLIRTVQLGLEQKRLKEDKARLLELTRRQNVELEELNNNLEKKVTARTEELQQMFKMLEKAHDSLKKNFISSIKVFSSLINMRDGEAGGHSSSVSAIARKIALKLKLNDDAIQNITVAGLLHDIGKIGLPDNIIDKCYEDLDPKNKRKVEKHPIVGQAMLMVVESLNEVGKIIRSHHERYDGQGYPDGLIGENIPLGSRILMIANDYDAFQRGVLISGKFVGMNVLSYLVSHKYKQYDPEIVDLFVSMMKNSEKEQAANTKKEILVDTSMLSEGMVLSKDLHSEEGTILLSKGQHINDRLVRSLRTYEKSIKSKISIYVKDQRISR